MKYLAIVVLAAIITGIWWLWPEKAIKDDAMLLGLTLDDFPEIEADVLEGMDKGIILTPDAIKGRNTWVLWTGGSQVFIDWMATDGFGLSDTLKMLDSRKRSTRFEDLGLVNEPGFMTAEKRDEYGLWLDVPDDGSDMGRVDAMIAEAEINERVYGRSTGVFGLRLFPNPNFDAEAEAYWDAEKYYDPDDDYSLAPDLVRPYRVGMTCGICHVAPHPLFPPADPNKPDWGNLATVIGNQYFREGRVFVSNLESPKGDERSSFLWEIMNAQPVGTSDTSRVATDHINNPNAINAIINLRPRLDVAKLNEKAEEEQSVATGFLPAPESPFIPRILKDGADSVGLPGATLRVYVNIGLFSQYWLTLHKPLLGVKYQEPFVVEKAQKNSVYWQATEQKVPNIKKFFELLQPMHLADAVWVEDGKEKSGSKLIASDEVLMRGKIAFAENCARCHSSKRPPTGVDLRSAEAKSFFLASVAAPDFLEGNFLSEDRRHSIEILKTNAARSVATNAKRGRIWDNFSSETYKNMDAVKRVQTRNLVTGEDDYIYDLEKRGVRHSLGYYRTPSLISIWSSAPFLHNNTVGKYTGDPSVKGRLEAFDDGARKLLGIEDREDIIWRTTRESEIEIPAVQLPKILQLKLKLAGLLEGPKDYRVLKIGPIPKGTAINLLASLDLSLGSIEDAEKAIRLVALAAKIKKVLLHITFNDLNEQETKEYMRKELLAELLLNSKCPDFVMDRGHYYGWDLDLEDKLALIEFLKTM